MSDWSESGSDHRPGHLAAPEGEVRANTPAVDETLRRVVVTYRLLVTIWMWILVGAVVGTGGPGSRPILLGALMFSTAWAGLTFWAGKATDRLGSASFLVLDGIVALALSGVGLIAGTDDFVSGGWPASWLFTVAFALTLKMTVVASFVLLAEHVLLHLAHGLNVIRIAGTFQFVVFAVIIGWAFDSLRDRERLRLRLQEELDREREELEIQREAAARHEERSSLARHLHDEVLQTFHAIEVSADRPEQVLYFVRRQTRELRRTIEEFRSPYSCSFRASLMRCRDEVEELYRGVKIREVIRTDAEVDPALEAVLGAAREAMMNAAKHAGVDQVDLYSEIEGDFVVVNVRDRGSGFDTDGPGGRRIATLMNERVEQAEGTVTIRSQPGRGTEVSIMAPLA
jgi:signal transduction histidine kinase